MWYAAQTVLRGEFVAEVHACESQTCCLQLVHVCVEFCMDKFLGKSTVIVEYLHLSFVVKFLLSSYYRLRILSITGMIGKNCMCVCVCTCAGALSLPPPFPPFILSLCHFREVSKSGFNVFFPNKCQLYSFFLPVPTFRTCNT